MSKKILIAGYYGFENAGDEAILSAMLADFRRQRSALEFIVVSSNPTETAALYNVQSVHWKDINGLLDAARKSDLIVVGGGGLFQDYWGVPDTLLTPSHWGISFYNGIGFLAALYQKPFMIYSVGVGPLVSEEGKRLARLTFDLASAATVRDVESQETLISLGIPRMRVSVVPDPALNLPLNTRLATKILRSEGNVQKRLPILGVCLRNWTEGEKSDGWKAELAAALDQFLETHNAQVIFIPFQVSDHILENDHSAALGVTSMMLEKERVIVLPESYSPEVVKGLISHCRLIVGMRLHSLIFAASSEIPAIALVYDPKVSNFMGSLGLSEFALDLRTLTVEQLSKTLKFAWAQQKQTRQILALRGGNLKVLAQKSTFKALELLDKKTKLPSSFEIVQGLAIKQISALAEKEVLVQALTAQVASMTEQAAIDYHEIDYLRWQVAYEQQLKDEILSSRVYKVAHKLRELRLFLLPPGGRLERTIKWLYRKPREILGRIREAIRRHGIFKATLRGIAIIGIRLAYPIKKILFNQKYERELKQLEQIIANHQGFFDVFHVPMGWHTLLFQRFQHVSLQTSKMGGLALYGGHPTVDKDVFVYQEVAKNLLVFKATDNQVVARLLAALEKRKDQSVVLRVQSIDLVTTAEDVQDFIRRGFKVVYEYIDEISPDITGNVPDLVHRRHEALLKDERVIVVATSDQIYEEVQRHRSQNFVLSTNGVDVDYWRTPRGDPPEDLRPALTGRMIVGYHGALAKWTDYDLLRMIADEGSYELVLIGHEHDDELPKSGLKEHPRVHFLGSKSYFDLNAYAAYYDIAILPFKKSNLTEAVSPVKIFEYMAALKPIVSTDLRECRKYKSCLIAETNEEFMAQLKIATSLRNDADYLSILDAEARENSWQAKTAEILKLSGVKL